MAVLARVVGFEPTTDRLTADCSTAELHPNRREAVVSREAGSLEVAGAVVNSLSCTFHPPLPLLSGSPRGRLAEW